MAIRYNTGDKVISKEHGNCVIFLTSGEKYIGNNNVEQLIGNKDYLIKKEKEEGLFAVNDSDLE